MSLTKEQKKDLKELGKQLHEFEAMALESNIDLDVFMTGYGEDGIQLYSTEKISQKGNAGKRKKVFESQDDQPDKTSLRHH